MIIDGKKIADALLLDLSSSIDKRKKSNRPTLSVISVGDNTASTSYIRQKKLAGKRVGAVVKTDKFKSTIPYQKLAAFVRDQSADKDIHGIIIQRPLPSTLSAKSLVRRIDLPKDVDGFRAKAPHIPPIGESVLTVLASAFWGNGTRYIKRTDEITANLVALLKTKTILLVGRGETGGKPIAKALSAHKVRFLMATSRTPLKNFAPEADIIISAVGKSRIITPSLVKPGAILISVGIWKDRKGKLRGDYNEDEIKDIASYYTPTPGGVGPVNVACLMKNVIEAAKPQKKA